MIANRYIRKCGVDCSVAADRAVIYDPNSGSATVLNPTGSLLWDRLEASSNHDELVQVLMGQYSELSEETARQDVHAYITSLVAAGLLEEVSGADA